MCGDNASYLDTLATAYFEAGQPDKAAETERRALTLKPDDPSYKKALEKYEASSPRTETLNLKDGNLHLQIPVVQPRRSIPTLRVPMALRALLATGGGTLLLVGGGRGWRASFSFSCRASIRVRDLPRLPAISRRAGTPNPLRRRWRRVEG